MRWGCSPKAPPIPPPMLYGILSVIFYGPTARIYAQSVPVHYDASQLRYGNYS